MLDVRKLAAIDLSFLGPKIILVEFGLGAAGLVALGLLSLRAGIQRERGATFIAWGIYMLGVGINYLPLLLHAISITRRGSAQKEIAEELGDRRAAFRKYRRQSLFILIPLAVMVLAVVQKVQQRRATPLVYH